MPTIADPRVHPSLLPKGSIARVINGPHNEYQDLPIIRTPHHRVITRWSLSEEEREAIAKGEDIYVTLIANSAINPLYVTVGPVDWTQDD